MFHWPEMPSQIPDSKNRSVVPAIDPYQQHTRGHRQHTQPQQQSLGNIVIDKAHSRVKSVSNTENDKQSTQDHDGMRQQYSYKTADFSEHSGSPLSNPVLLYIRYR